jgi:flagella basal body P-ring formation protein FlgA
MNPVLQLVTIALTVSSLAAAPLRVTVAFRDSTTVNDTVIRLGDIAVLSSDGSLGNMEVLKNAIVGEAAPAGYCRKVNSGEVVTYVLKKAAAGFSFAPIASKAVLVRTAFTEKKIGDYEQAIIKYVTDSVKWEPGDFSVTVRNTDEKWKCLDKPLTVQVAGLSSRFPKGNVNLKLIVNQYAKVYSVPVVCFVTVGTPVIVAKTAIPRGAMLTNENCVSERKDITHYACNPFTDLSQLKGLIVNRTIQPETILNAKLTTRMPIIGKDEQVYVVVDRGRVRVSIIMRARGQGALGDMIWVENELTHKLLKTKVIGKGKVELMEGVKAI